VDLGASAQPHALVAVVYAGSADQAADRGSRSSEHAIDVRDGPAESCDLFVICATFRAVNAFHVIGGILALWAVLVTFLGLTREGFPNGKPQERLVTAISIILVAGAIGSAIYTSATEEEEEEQHEGEAAALVR
jgi:hypothetical protein